MTEQNVELDTPLKRLQRESHDNDERLKTLESLLQKPQPSFISDWQWNYLKLQRHVMRDYSIILSYRQEYWDKSPNNEDLLALEYQATMLGDRPLISQILARPPQAAVANLGEQHAKEMSMSARPPVPEGMALYRANYEIPARPITFGDWRRSQSPGLSDDQLIRTSEEPNWDTAGFEFYMFLGHNDTTGAAIYDTETTWQEHSNFLHSHVASITGLPPAIEINHEDMLGTSESVTDCPLKDVAPMNYDFPSAFRRLIGGERIARQGWNGKDMWLSVSNLEVNTVPAERFWSKHNRAHALQNGGSAEVPPCVTLKNAKGQVQMGWLPSQEDLFANDWVVLSNDSLPEVTADPAAVMPMTYPSALHIQTKGVKGKWLPHDRPMDLVRELGLKCYGDRATLASISVTALLCHVIVGRELIGHAYVYLPVNFTLEQSEHSRSIRLRAPVTILVADSQYSFLGDNDRYSVHSDSVTMTLEEGKLLSVQVDEMELVNKGTGDVNNEHILPNAQLYYLGYALQGQVKLSEGALITVSPDVGTLDIEQK